VDKIRSVKDDRYKLIKFAYEGKVTTLLYDFANDPFELANLYEMDEYKDVVTSLEALLVEYKDEWEDVNHSFSDSFWNQVK
jgi:arylsulfatase A-like enzyme